MSDSNDIVVTNVGSGLSTAHLASLTHGTRSMIYAFGDLSERESNQVSENFERLAVSGSSASQCQVRAP